MIPLFSRGPGSISTKLGARRGGFRVRPAVGFLSLHAAYTHLDTRVVNDADTSQIGLPLVRRPANSGSVSIALAPKRWTFAAGARFVGERQEQDFVFYAVTRNPSYTFVFVDGSWKATRHLTPFLRVNNLLNAELSGSAGIPGSVAKWRPWGLRITW